MKRLFLITLLFLATGVVAQATVKTVTYTITDCVIGTNTVEVTFTRNGDTFEIEPAETFTAYFNKSALFDDGTSGHFSVELADGFNIHAYWSAGSNVQISNYSFYSKATGKYISYSVSCDSEYYVTHVTMKNAEGTQILFSSPVNHDVDYEYESVCGFYRTYQSYGSFGQLIVTYSDVPTILNLSLNEVEGRYWGSFYSSAGYRLPEGAAAFSIDENNNLHRVGTDGRTIPASTGVVILSDKEDITLNYTTENATLHGNNVLKGAINPVTLVNGKVGDDVPYVLSMVNGTLGMYRFTGSELPAGKAFSANGKEVYLSTLTKDITVKNGQTLIGTLTNSVRITIEDGATITLQNVTINRSGNKSSAGITCLGSATIVLSGSNVVNAFSDGYPGIQAGPEGTTLTIRGNGSLMATGKKTGAGIGTGKDMKCGNILIEGGTITATGGIGAAGIGSGCSSLSSNKDNHENTTCGNITITGGEITANGGMTSSGGSSSGFGSGNYNGGAGIGSGAVSTCGDISISGGTVTAIGTGSVGIGCGAGGMYNSGIYDNNNRRKSVCGSITINSTSGATYVRAEKNVDFHFILDSALDAIGRSDEYSVCEKVQIGGTVYWAWDENTNSYRYMNNGENILTQTPLIYPTNFH